MLVNCQYSVDDRKAIVGFLMTILHESAHLARKVKDGKYNIEQKTPAEKVNLIQPRGMPTIFTKYQRC